MIFNSKEIERRVESSTFCEQNSVQPKKALSYSNDWTQGPGQGDWTAYSVQSPLKAAPNTCFHERQIQSRGRTSLLTLHLISLEDNFKGIMYCERRKMMKNSWVSMRNVIWAAGCLLTSHHRIRIWWIYVPAEVQIIPCQIQGYVYIVQPFQNSSFKLKDIARAHDVRRICHSLSWLLCHCSRLSFETLWGPLEKTDSCLFVAFPFILDTYFETTARHHNVYLNYY